MEGKPFVHLLKSSFGYYVYDVNTNEIIAISKEVYEYLNGDNALPNINTKRTVQQLIDRGYLKADRVMISEHPVTEYYSSYLKHKLSHITLQVTQQCNLNCEYCVYSGSYYNRHHSDKRMKWETAKKAIDYLIKNSQDSDQIAISFYGGEPLIEFELIKKCVVYAEREVEGKRVLFNFTTNGTLLTDEIISFLVEHNISILVSLDGSKSVHDKHRKFIDGTGSFEVIMKNLSKIKKDYSEYYGKRVSFNTVLDPANGFTKVKDFFANNTIFDNMMFSSSTISDNYAKTELQYSEEFTEELEYEMFKLFMWKLGKIESQDVSPLVLNYFSTHKRIATMMNYHQDKILTKNHRGGPCLPGVKRLFVSVDGNLFPCERVSETSNAAYLGNIEQGINLKNALELLNIEKKTSENCRSCWAYYFCNICVAQADDGNEISGKKIKSLCKKTKLQVEQELLDYIALRELGYKHEMDF